MKLRLWTQIAQRAARAYVAGPELSDAARACRGLAAHGFATAIAYWDSGSEPAQDVACHYGSALRAAASLGAGCCYVSVKAPALGMNVGLLSELLERAQRVGTAVHFDSLGPETAAATLRLLPRLLGVPAPMGCTLPGRWRRSQTDADTAARLGLRVRVVKGQWPDEIQPEPEPSAGFLAVVNRLAGHACHVAVATHDVRLSRMALGILQRAGTSCELELLWGFPHAGSVRLACEMQVAVRFYVPYGHAWLPYVFSQFRKNPRILLWITRDLLSATCRGSFADPNRAGLPQSSRGTAVPLVE